MLMMTTPLGARSIFGGRTPQRPPSRWWQSGSALGAIGTGAVVLFGKTKYLLAALKFTKLASLGSMVLTIGTYSMFFGLPYAVGVVGLIAVHEGGHAWVMKQRGIPFSPAVFIPFMGAVIVMKGRPRDAWEDALIAFGGPIAGSVGAVGVAAVGHATQSQLCLALADFGFMVNLFNLMPIGSMDGGRIADALSPYAGVAGLGMGGFLFYEGYISNPIMALILLAGGWHSFNRFYYPEAIPPNYYKITPTQRLTLTGGYFGLIAALMAATAINNQKRKPPEVLEMERRRETTWDMR